MMSDVQWTVLEPVMEARPKTAKHRPRSFRRMISAILYRHRNGAKWRAVSDELGPW